MRWMIGGMLLVVAWGIALQGVGFGASIEDLLEAARQGAVFRPSDAVELARAEVLFGRILDGSADGKEMLSALKSEWNGLGYRLETVSAGGKSFLALLEKPSHRRGRGFFLFPLRPAGDLLLQAPHGFKDLYTGEIGVKLFPAGRFAGAAWNTVSRYETEEGGRGTADLSDRTDTLFAALARAFAERYPEGHVVQLHGYARGKRDSLSGRVSDMILSNGTHRPPPWLEGMDRCLEGRFSVVVSRFPVETDELGATRTSIGIVMRQMGHAGFFHLEMSREMRERLRDDDAAREDLLGCLGEVLGW